MVGELRAHEYLDALYRIQEQHAQGMVELVEPKHAVQAGTGYESVRSGTVGIEVGRKPILIDLGQDGDERIFVRYEPAGEEEVRLILQGLGRLLIPHDRPPDKKTPTEVSCILRGEA